MTTYKISALTAVATPAETDQHEVNQGGTSKRITSAQILGLRGLLVMAHTSANVTFTTLTNAIVNFDSVDYDPGSLVTTGAAWHFTAPATGYYQVSVDEGYIDSLTNNWAAHDVIEMYLYKNGSYYQTIDSFWAQTAVTGANLPYWVLHGTCTIQLNAAQTCAINFTNDTAASRRLDSLTRINIARVA